MLCLPGPDPVGVTAGENPEQQAEQSGEDLACGQGADPADDQEYGVKAPEAAVEQAPAIAVPSADAQGLRRGRETRRLAPGP